MYNMLIVDDEENILHALRRMLSKSGGWEIVICSDPLDALDITRNNKFDLFLSDYRMPGMNGVEFLMHTKRFHPDAMRLILSGATDFEGLIDAINKAEIHRFLGKPIQAYDLINTIKQALQYYEIKMENKLLVERVRIQQEELNKREIALQRFSQKHPVLAQVNWDSDGSIIFDEDEI